MSVQKPIKRAGAIQNFSREHHYGLLLCWKIKTGFKKGIALTRIKAYANWFYEKDLLPHFIAEEKLIFPVLGLEHKLIKKAIEDHKMLSKLFTAKTNLAENLAVIANELTQHIRFEERQLFNEIQQVATAVQLQEIELLHSQITIDDYQDTFWV